MAEVKTVGIFLTSMTIGGVERVALNLASGLSDHGYEIDLILVDAVGQFLSEVPEDVTIINLGKNRVATSILPLIKYLKSRELDVLFSMMTEPNLIAIAASVFTPTDTRLIISEHNMLSQSSDSTKDRLVALGAWASYPLADHTVAVSEGVHYDIASNTRLTSDSISVIYNPVKVDSIREEGDEPAEHRWLADETLDVVLSGGRHEPQKGFDTLLDAFTRLERDDVRLIIFGEGPETDTLKALAETKEIESFVSFPGFIDNPYNYMSNSDIFVLSSEYEGFGVVLIEAMACGCPVVSTDCESGPAEILDNGTYGSLTPVGDDEALARAIQETLDNPLPPEMLYQRAADFDISTVINNYVQLIDSVIEM